jgi:hypothetical protein
MITDGERESAFSKLMDGYRSDDDFLVRLYTADVRMPRNRNRLNGLGYYSSAQLQKAMVFGPW